MLPDSFVLTADAQAEFYRHQPIDFFLYDEEGNPNLYILNDNVPGKAHNLILVNESEQDLELTGNTTIPGINNFHFELRFRPGTIDANFHNWITTSSGDWLIQSKLWKAGEGAGIPAGTVSLFLVYRFETVLTFSFRSSRLIPLHGLKSGPGGGSRGAKAELRYRLNGNKIVASSGGQATLHFRQERLEIINQRGVRNIPLEAGFSLGNRVLNNGETNELSLQLTNLLRNSHIPFQGKNTEAPTRLVLSFDTSEKAEYWALFDEDNALGMWVEVHGSSTFWHIEKEVQGQTPQWILSPSEEIELDAGESFTINLSKLISSMPSGVANLYVQYENVPGYWDDLYMIPIEKTPFYLQDKRDEKGNTIKTIVGIGTHEVDPDGAALQIIGGLNVDTINGGGFVPKGGVIMWAGAENDVPEGWHLCDGNKGAKINGLIIPDLRSRFIVGAGEGTGLSAYTSGQTGGEETHTLTSAEIPDHTHTASIGAAGEHFHDIPENEPIQDISNTIDFPGEILDTSASSGADMNGYIKSVKTQKNGAHIHSITIDKTTGGGGAHENRPPYYALAFIIKL